MSSEQKKVFYGKAKFRESYGSARRLDFIEHAKTTSQYSKMFAGFKERDKLRVTVEKVSDKEWKKEVFGDPR